MNQRKIYIEITTACNLRCSFCAQSSRAPKFMDEQLFRQILAAIAGKPKRLFLHVMGEPLLHPKIGHFLKLCAEERHEVFLVTNGRLLLQRSSDLLGITSLRQISISLHSLEHQMNDADLQTYIDQICSFAKLASTQERLWLVLRLWNRDSGDCADHDLNQRILNALDTRLKLPPHQIGKDLERQRINLGKNLNLEFSSRFAWPSRQQPYVGTQGTCYGLRDQIAILVDGTVVPCCLDSEGEMALGQIDHQSLKEILSSSRAQNIHSGFITDKVTEELCQHCSYRLRFSANQNSQG